MPLVGATRWMLCSSSSHFPSLPLAFRPYLYGAAMCYGNFGSLSVHDLTGVVSSKFGVGHCATPGVILRAGLEPRSEMCPVRFWQPPANVGSVRRGTPAFTLFPLCKVCPALPLRVSYAAEVGRGRCLRRRSLLPTSPPGTFAGVLRLLAASL